MSETDPFYSEESDEMSKRTQLEEFFSQSLEVELLLRLCPDDEDTIYQIVDLLVDTCANKRKMLHVAGDDKPAEVVRSRFMKLNADHIRFVLKCLAENSNPIRNMKQYLLASLYNAPTTIASPMPRFSQVVVMPVPPFWLTMAIVVAFLEIFITPVSLNRGWSDSDSKAAWWSLRCTEKRAGIASCS